MSLSVSPKGHGHAGGANKEGIDTMAAATPTPDDEKRQEIYLTEFVRLREEIDYRNQMGAAVLTGAVAALGTALSVASGAPDALVAVAAVIVFLGIFWMDSHRQVCRLDVYIATQLAPRLSPVAESALGWQRYQRECDSDGRRRRLLRRKWGTLLLVVLPLAVIPFALSGAYAYLVALQQFSDPPGYSLGASVARYVGAFIVWVFAAAGLLEFIIVRREVKKADALILASGDRSGTAA